MRLGEPIMAPPYSLVADMVSQVFLSTSDNPLEERIAGQIPYRTVIWGCLHLILLNVYTAGAVGFIMAIYTKSI